MHEFSALSMALKRANYAPLVKLLLPFWGCLHKVALTVYLQINWVSLLNSMLKYADVQVDEREEAVVYMPEYMQDLTRLIQTWQNKDNGNR